MAAALFVASRPPGQSLRICQAFQAISPTATTSASERREPNQPGVSAACPANRPA